MNQLTLRTERMVECAALPVESERKEQYKYHVIDYFCALIYRYLFSRQSDGTHALVNCNCWLKRICGLLYMKVHFGCSILYNMCVPRDASYGQNHWAIPEGVNGLQV